MAQSVGLLRRSHTSGVEGEADMPRRSNDAIDLKRRLLQRSDMSGIGGGAEVAAAP